MERGLKLHENDRSLKLLGSVGLAHNPMRGDTGLSRIHCDYYSKVLARGLGTHNIKHMINAYLKRFSYKDADTSAMVRRQLNRQGPDRWRL